MYLGTKAANNKDTDYLRGGGGGGGVAGSVVHIILIYPKAGLSCDKPR